MQRDQRGCQAGVAADLLGHDAGTGRGGQRAAKQAASATSVKQNSAGASEASDLAPSASAAAARAGEQGHGFALLACEVRNLAPRSAAAAKQIKELISDSVNQVHSGSKLVEQAGATMGDVVVNVRRVTDIMSEISAAGRAARRYRAGQRRDRRHGRRAPAKRRNAALAEEATAASQNMQQQAAALSEPGSVLHLSRSSGRALATRSDRKRLTA